VNKVTRIEEMLLTELSNMAIKAYVATVALPRSEDVWSVA